MVDKPAGLAVKIRQIDHFWKVVNRLETGAARKGAGSQRFNASEFLIAPSCNRGQTHAFCLQIPSVRLTEQVACSKPNLDLEHSNKACPHSFFPFRQGLGRNRSQDHTATCSFLGGCKNVDKPAGLAVKIRQIDHFWKVVNRLETGAARKGAGSQRFNASEFLIAPSCNRGQTHAFCLQIPSVRLTEQVACSKPNLDLEHSNKATCPHSFFPFRRGLGRNRSQDHTATCSLFWGSKKHALGPWPCCARCEKCRL